MSGHVFLDLPTPRGLRQARRLGGIRWTFEGKAAGFQHVTAHVGQVRHPDGRAVFPSLQQEARAIARFLRAEVVEHDGALRRWSKGWPPHLLALQLERRIEEHARRELYRMVVARWQASGSLAGTRPEITLLVRAGLSDAALAPAAARFGIERRTYESRTRALPPTTLAPSSPSSVAPTARLSKRPRVAVRYWYRGIDPAAGRSDLFWQPHTHLQAQDLMLVGVDRDPMGASSNSPPFFGNAPSARRMNPGPAYWMAAAARLALRAPNLFGAHKHVRREAVVADLQRRRWLRFFRRQGARLLVAPTFSLEPAQAAAMKQAGGATIAYQYSASHFQTPVVALTAGEDVQAVFGDGFAQLWNDIRAQPAPRLVTTGFIHDLAPERAQARAQELRQALQGKGAKKVLAFFDENSLNRWDIHATDEDAARDYEFLLSWILEDKGIGLLIKPKKPLTLLQRIGGLAPLIEEATATGRCKILLPEAGRPDDPPSVAALASDLSIGKLLGTTAAMEAAVLGRRAILVDTDALLDHPLRALAPDLVFASWEALRVSLNRGSKTLGDWTTLLQKIGVPDGRGAERLAATIERMWQDGSIPARTFQFPLPARP